MVEGACYDQFSLLCGDSFQDLFSDIVRAHAMSSGHICHCRIKGGLASVQGQ